MQIQISQRKTTHKVKCKYFDFRVTIARIEKQKLLLNAYLIKNYLLPKYVYKVKREIINKIYFILGTYTFKIQINNTLSQAYHKYCIQSEFGQVLQMTQRSELYVSLYGTGPKRQ